MSCCVYMKTSGLGLWLYLCLGLGIPAKGNAVLTIPVSNLKLEGMEHLRNILDQPKRKFTLGEKVYIGSMTIVLSCRIALYILLRITGCVKRLI